MNNPFDCPTHGAQEWRGHLVCSLNAGGCGEVYQTQEPMAERFAALDCTTCAKRLMPATAGEDPLNAKGFTARSFCPRCFETCIAAVTARAAERAAIEHDTDPPPAPPEAE